MPIEVDALMSVPQPYATLVAEEVKTSLTSSEPAPHSIVGKRFAIFASEQPVAPADIEPLPEPIRSTALWMSMLDCWPYDTTIATATLVDCVRSRGHSSFGSVLTRRDAFDHHGPRLPDDNLGDYSAGRWIWLLADVEKIGEPIPAQMIGELQVWEFSR